MADRNDRWQRVSQKAFELYESRGGTDGRHVEDWLEAERLIDLEADGLVDVEADGLVDVEAERVGKKKKEEELRTDGAARKPGKRAAAVKRADAGGTTPEERDRASTVPRGGRKRSKSATL